MKQSLILAGLSIALSLSVFSLGYLKGKNSCISQQANTIIKEVKNEAQSFANRPKSDSDVIKRLCKWAAIRAKDEGRTLQQLPDGSCK